MTNQRETLSREHRGLSLLDYWESLLSERFRDYSQLKAERDRTAATLYQAVQRRLVIELAKGFFLEARAGGLGADVTSPPAGTAGTELGAARIGGGAGAGRLTGPSSKAAVVASDGDAEGALAGGSAAVTDQGLRFAHLAGIISTEEKTRFGRIVFRASAGHAVCRFADCYDPLYSPLTGQKEQKSVFCIFYRGKTLGAKLERIAAAFNAHSHDVPSFSSPAAVAQATEECRRVIDESCQWLRNEAENSATSLRHIALLLRKWKDGVRREKACFHTLNCFLRQPERGTLYAQGWVLKSALQSVQEAVADAHASAASGGRMLPFVLEVLTQKAPLPGSPSLSHAHDGAASSAAVALPGDFVLTSSGSRVVIPAPPTHFNTNKVTAVFQGIVNTYGVPRYGEANPAIWTIATFPFLFGVMYGDVGHAIFISLAALYLLLREEHYLRVQRAGKMGEMLAMAFKGRYLIFFMGLFAIYCGLVYNDAFSIAFNAFGGTRWFYPPVPRNETLANGTVITVEGLATVAMKKGGIQPNGQQDWALVYPFGVDPTWHSSDNDLLFFNSLKMKTAVIIGIIQMTFGLFLKVSNALHFKSKVDLFLEAIPQVIFMVGLFGYMVFLIVLKWSINWNDPAYAQPGSIPGAPPSLIDTLINVVLKPGTVQDPMFASQASLQVVILLIVFACVPVMLFGKPLAIHFQGKAEREAAANKKRDDHHHSETSGLIGSGNGAADTGAVVVANPAFAAGTGAVGSPSAAASGAGAGAAPHQGSHGGHHDESADAGHGAGGHGHSFGDVFVHQAIETIEFVLGSVSNTASYLRLWALSLAHSQLATVFWERALQATIESGSAIMIFVGWGMFAAITMGVLLLMDVLECFLHALRLHWVEFQNKMSYAFLASLFLLSFVAAS